METIKANIDLKWANEGEQQRKMKKQHQVDNNTKRKIIWKKR